jgi:hypothetical protein
LLLVRDEELKADHIINAMALRDEYYSNQYHKIWLVGKQLQILLFSCAVGLLLFVPLVIFFSKAPAGDIQPWQFEMVSGVLSFGLLGASFSAAGSLMGGDPATRIPERVANHFVTLARSVFGACAGLAGYAFYECKAFNLHFGNDNHPGSGLAVACVFGFAGEKLIAQFLGTLGSQKP